MRGMMPQGVTPPDPTGPSGQQATPEMQDEYNRFVGMGIMALTDEKFMKSAAKSIKSNPNKADAMAKIGAAIAARIHDAAESGGQTISPAVLIHGGAELMEKIGEFATKAGAGEVTPEDIETAYYLAADQMHDVLGAKGALDGSYAADDEDEFLSQHGAEIENVRKRIQGARDMQMQSMMGGR